MTDEIEKVTRRHGLFRNVPRSLRTAIERRLAVLEGDDDRFDRTAVRDRVRLKRLYALLHVRPGPRAQQSLFGMPPAGSPLDAIREIGRHCYDDAGVARLVRRHRLPFLAIDSAVGVTEPIAVALIETMEPAELLSRLPLLARRELLQKEPVREALLYRLRSLRASPPPGLTYRKVESVVRQSGVDRETAEALMALVQGAGAGTVSGDTALLLDASLSMARVGPCLELAAQIGHRLDAALSPESALHAIVFAREARRLDLRHADIGRWRHELSIPPSDLATGTSVGAALELLTMARAAVRRLVLVTDGYENRPPRLVSALASYRSATGAAPSIHLVQPPGAARQLAVDLKNASIPFEVFQVDAHLLGLDAFLSVLDQEAEDLFALIAATPLPR